MYAEVALPLSLNQTFTYRLPPAAEVDARVGARVVVPFGKKALTGYIVALRQEPGPDLDEIRIKDVIQLVDREPIIDEGVLQLTRWLSQFYFASWGEAIRAALPAGLTVGSEILFSITPTGRETLANVTPARLQHSTRAQALHQIAGVGEVSLAALQKKFGKARAQAIVRALEASGAVERQFGEGESHVKPKVQNVARLAKVSTDGKRLTEQQQRVVDVLSTMTGPTPLGPLADRAGVGPSVIRGLEKRGLIEIFPQPIRRDPLGHVRVSPPEWFELTERQQAALQQIEAKLDEGTYGTFLLHGVTGSGKTEVYIRAMHKTLDRGKTALMLVPEIALTPVFSRRLRSHFGEQVAILHSSLSEGERFDEWHRVRQGAARVVIGTRSAVFAPLHDLGLVVVDEEHETSYKQAESPRYHGRDTAIMRAHQQNAVVVLGSATPSMESFHNAHTGKSVYIQLGERIGGRQLAEVRVVDMREVFDRRGQQQVFSEELVKALEETYRRRQQAIILLNRRGFAPFVFCRRCGLGLRCANCDVALTYHQAGERLVCHYCNYQTAPPRACEACGGEFIFYAGVGTEQVEARLRRMFPDMAMARMDRDTMRRRGSYEQIITEFSAGSIQTLIGTQMLAKGHDFPNVTLVGVVSVDAVLGLPDFRSAERAFQLLTQVAGRAGRGDTPGRVLIQTYYPDHYVLRYAQAQDYAGFYQQEIGFRQTYHYPPLTTLVLALIHHPKPDKATAIADVFAKRLRAAAQASTAARFIVKGPAPAPLGRLRGEHRLHVILIGRNRAAARQTVELALTHTREAGYDTHAITVDVDPVDLM
jgi:primosomal protein N' (replication factor Y)